MRHTNSRRVCFCGPAVLLIALAALGCGLSPTAAAPDPAEDVSAAGGSEQSQSPASSTGSQENQAMDDQQKPKLATLAGGCFWCTEAIFLRLDGVESVVSGYSGGHVERPTYEQVCTGRTGHAEAIQIRYDPQVISYEDLLLVFFATHDPTTLNRQGPDVGPQYRSAIFYHDQQQKESAERVIQKLDEGSKFPRPIVTEVTEFTNFYPAEAYHQDFFNKNPRNPYCRAKIPPKLVKLRKEFAELMKQSDSRSR
jgi:peptide-methionine (S)-S-oxide reductase